MNKIHALLEALLVSWTHVFANGLHIDARVGIPKTLFITAPFGPQSAERSRITERFAEHCPSGMDIIFFDDEAMNRSANEISQTLAESGIVNGSFSAYNAFTLLRPLAYRADLWRYMALWQYGGVYVDANIDLTADVSSWVDFGGNKLVLIKDTGGYNVWNAMMASPPRNYVLASLIQKVVNRVHRRLYGRNNLDVTGPETFLRALLEIPDATQRVTADYQVRKLPTTLPCGGYPGHHCKVSVVGVAESTKGVRIADKGSAELSPTHYSRFYRQRQVYCDEPGPPCRL